MKRAISLVLITLLLSALVGACGGGGSGGGGTTTAPPAAQNPSGVWNGQSVTAAAADVPTSFEFSATGGFSIGTSPYTATFDNGNAETRGIPGFYISGLNAWHVLVGTVANVTFETLPNSLNFWVRTANATDVATIRILDETGAEVIPTIVPNNNYVEITINLSPGDPLIEVVEVTSTSGGDVVIDDFTFGYSGSGFAGSTDDIACLVADSLEFVCILNDPITDALVVSAQGTVQVANTNQVSGSGMMYAVPGSVLANGKTVANLTISLGTVSEGNSLDLIIDAGGATTVASTTYDAIYERGSDLATVAAVYTTFDIFGDPSSFTIDAAGAISGQSNAGCVLDGQVTIMNAAFNAYDVALDVVGVANCGVLNGMYNGLGVTQDNAAMDDVFVLVVFTNQSTVAGVAEK